MRTTNYHQMPTISNIAYFDKFYCIGFDSEKVLAGQEDLTKLSDIDSSKKWSKLIVACQIKFYKDVNTTQAKMRKDNALMGFHNELN